MIQTITGVLAKKRYLTDDVLFLSFTVPKEFTFQAGQYVMIQMTRNGVARLKPYSVLSPPSQKGALDFCVKIIEGGFASEGFKEMEPGGEFIFKGPLGRFLFDEQGEDHWFICTGTGMTPFYSMLREHLPKHPQKQFTLLFGVRTRQNLFLHEKLLELAATHHNFSYIPTLSRDEWDGKTGRVQAHLPANLQDKTFYICGLKELVLETQELLLKKGVAPQNIHFERYT